jgi:tetratricopeptide (TPR) repeat protein
LITRRTNAILANKYSRSQSLNPQKASRLQEHRVLQTLQLYKAKEERKNMSQEIARWENKILQIRNSIIQSARDMGILLQDIEQTMLTGTVNIEDHIVDDSIWNALGLFFVNRRDYSASETVYRHMLESIDKINTRKLHRGLALYNLGISQINTKNFDEGIPNVLAAYEEDVNRIGKTRARKLFANKLKDGFLNEMYNTIDSNYFKKLIKSFPKSFLLRFEVPHLIDLLDESERLFLMKVIISHDVTPFRKDTYTKVLLFDNLKNIYLLIEIVLKKKNVGMLGKLVDDMFTGQNWCKASSQAKQLTHFDRGPNRDPVLQFKINFKQILKMTHYRNEQKFLVKLFLVTVLMRNYTSHFFDDYRQILHNRNTYSFLFESAIYALLYCLSTVK